MSLFKFFKKSTTDLALDYNKQEAKLRKNMVGKLTSLITTEKVKATACKRAIRSLDAEQKAATAEIGEANRLKAKLEK